ncbi:MAG: hypothetical protein AAF383_11545 [Cyanobacteria bacterium P01_A01_bin.83]
MIAMQPIIVTEAAQQLLGMIDVVMRREGQLSLKKKSSIAKITTATPINSRLQFGSARELIAVANDFDELLNNYK